METVNEHCKHKDCVYRLAFDSKTDFCNYCVMEGEPRGCRISECTRYKTGDKKVVMTAEGLNFLWKVG